MQHIDEYTLELYVLGSDLVRPRRDAIDAHLKGCLGCRALADEMRGIHADLANAIEAEEAPVPLEQALVRREQRLGRHAGVYGAPLRYEPRTPSQKLRWFLARHPVGAAAAAVSFAALFVALGMLISNSFTGKAGSSPGAITDWNPDFIRYGTDWSYLEVYNREHDLLWKSKLQDDGNRTKRGGMNGVLRAAAEDIDGDGIKEVLTVEMFADDNLMLPPTLRVFDGHRRLLRQEGFERKPSYLDRDYSPYIALDAMCVRTNEATHRKEIFVTGPSWGRSPRFLARLDDHYQVLGEYWHFGEVTPFVLDDIDGDGKAELIGVGENDNDDSSSLGPIPVMIVLDPDGIVGTTRSSASPGFHLKTGGAEKYYLAFPATNLDSAMSMHGMAKMIEKVGADAYSVAVSTNSVSFNYVIASDMRVVEVKANDILHLRVAELTRSGVPARNIDGEYLDRLRRGVRYWDGSAWREEPVRVRAGTEVP
jgi:hypothetical protein